MIKRDLLEFTHGLSTKMAVQLDCECRRVYVLDSDLQHSLCTTHNKTPHSTMLLHNNSPTHVLCLQRNLAHFFFPFSSSPANFPSVIPLLSCTFNLLTLISHPPQTLLTTHHAQPGVVSAAAKPCGFLPELARLAETSAEVFPGMHMHMTLTEHGLLGIILSNHQTLLLTLLMTLLVLRLLKVFKLTTSATQMHNISHTSNFQVFFVCTWPTQVAKCFALVQILDKTHSTRTVSPNKDCLYIHKPKEDIHWKPVKILKIILQNCLPNSHSTIILPIIAHSQSTGLNNEDYQPHSITHCMYQYSLITIQSLDNLFLWILVYVMYLISWIERRIVEVGMDTQVSVSFTYERYSILLDFSSDLITVGGSVQKMRLQHDHVSFCIHCKYILHMVRVQWWL
ncbi:hypothetical protein VP01_2151g1 [Puccinia sorghi]|uniref:Uncharacterized protein n=1 Tax=Puccinia sorghi TaxID=27349 RepID=A0A0L6V9N8_9BASI|nr:hypothetical protein VP01_2151g1 [Puccinia sorghi]